MSNQTELETYGEPAAAVLATFEKEYVGDWRTYVSDAAMLALAADRGEHLDSARRILNRAMLVVRTSCPSSVMLRNGEATTLLHMLSEAQRSDVRAGILYAVTKSL